VLCKELLWKEYSFDYNKIIIWLWINSFLFFYFLSFFILYLTIYILNMTIVKARHRQRYGDTPYAVGCTILGFWAKEEKESQRAMQQLLNTNVRAKAGANRAPRLLRQGWQSRSVTTINHILIKKITRNRKRPKKTFTNFIIIKKIFEGQYRKKLEIFIFIDCYNYYMNSMNVINQLRATIIIHFSRNKKKFFPEMFWAIDMILINCWKIYKSLYNSFISLTEKKQPTIYKTFLKILIKFLFFCNFENYAKNVSGIFFKKYPKYNYISHKTGRKPKETPLNFTNLSQKTPLIFKRDFEHPRTFIPTKIIFISLH
jgi:hypothetical protein